MGVAAAPVTPRQAACGKPCSAFKNAFLSKKTNTNREKVRSTCKMHLERRTAHNSQRSKRSEQRAALNDQRREEKQYKVHGVLLCAFWRAIGDVRSAV
jgi:hypothetical protein